MNARESSVQFTFKGNKKKHTEEEKIVEGKENVIDRFLIIFQFINKQKKDIQNTNKATKTKVKRFFVSVTFFMVATAMTPIAK